MVLARAVIERDGRPLVLVVVSLSSDGRRLGEFDPATAGEFEVATGDCAAELKVPAATIGRLCLMLAHPHGTPQQGAFGDSSGGGYACRWSTPALLDNLLLARAAGPLERQPGGIGIRPLPEHTQRACSATGCASVG